MSMLTKRCENVMCMNCDVRTEVSRQASCSTYGPHSVHASAKEDPKKLAPIECDWIAVTTQATTQIAMITVVAGAERT